MTAVDPLRTGRRSLFAAVAGGAAVHLAARSAASKGGFAGAPAASPALSDRTAAVTLVATGLVNPRGMAFRPDGTLLVAIGGKAGPNAGVVEVTDGCPRVIVDGLPTARVAFRAIAGVSDLAVLDGRTFLLLAGGNAEGGTPPNGIYEFDDDGAVTLLADLSTFIRDNPVAEVPADYDADGQPYALAVEPRGDGFLVTEGNSNQLLRVSVSDGSIERIADLSSGHPIPTGLAVDDEGAVHVAYFTAAPYEEGTARVVRILPDGMVSDVWRGLSLVIDLAFGPDGTLWALEMATGHGDDPGAIRSGTGRVVRRGADGDSIEVATGLELPTRMRFASDGALYVSGPAFGADDGEGWVIRHEPVVAESRPIATPAITSLTRSGECPT
ncbi:MAG: hypothetical protein AVDCRST_MAG70-642 [uncultured Thermomicrobiales bacterium]|uniref:ScyD/ScyE family protein n=1 Tax=uncultured Thermomicrobiales bacterium TaxID=1645740 RepID=A0A6J4UD63_9BACT|nr:MAG: hypothetical protein AVDCRST_MAG70-642 [uncultured Thermomicrobiales bacterium]